MYMYCIDESTFIEIYQFFLFTNNPLISFLIRAASVKKNFRKTSVSNTRLNFLSVNLTARSIETLYHVYNYVADLEDKLCS